MVKKEKKHVVTFAATPREMKMLELIRTTHKRKTYTDTLRVLVMRENEKILAQNIAVATQQA